MSSQKKTIPCFVCKRPLGQMLLENGFTAHPNCKKRKLPPEKGRKRYVAFPIARGVIEGRVRLIGTQ